MEEYLELNTIFDPQKRAAMQEAIDLAWQTTNPEAIEFQRRMFPLGKPTVGEFIITAKFYAVAKLLSDKLP